MGRFVGVGFWGLVLGLRGLGLNVTGVQGSRLEIEVELMEVHHKNLNAFRRDLPMPFEF